MATIFLGLGSNIGKRRQYIEQAVDLLSERITNISLAPLYHSKAWGVTEQPDFLNTALRGETELEPHELLEFVKSIEREVGRVERFRWGPREIDIDIIYYGNIVLELPDLSIPHVGAHERDTVLQPICDIDPDFIDPRSKLSVSVLLNKLPESKVSILKPNQQKELQ